MEGCEGTERRRSQTTDQIVAGGACQQLKVATCCHGQIFFLGLWTSRSPSTMRSCRLLSLTPHHTPKALDCILSFSRSARPKKSIRLFAFPCIIPEVPEAFCKISPGPLLRPEKS